MVLSRILNIDSLRSDQHLCSQCRCSILVVSHGDPLQILQTIVNATKQVDGSVDFLSRIQAVRNPTILSQHRKFALETGELRAVI